MLREFAREARILAKLYHDEMDVFRSSFEIDPDTRETRNTEVCIYRNHKCGLSQSAGDPPERGTIVSETTDTYTIFADVDVRLQENDRVVVRVADGETYEGRSGKTFCLRSHGETPVKIEKVS